MKTNQLLVLFFLFSSLCFGLTGAKYLIITPDNFASAVQPLADWKTKKGVKAMVVPLSVTGNSASQIKNYIVNAYNNWSIRPEYILLAGHGSVLPASGTSDDYYANITGNYRIELSIGRLPAADVTQCNMLVAKILGYERNPYLGDSLWFRKGTTVIREDNPPGTYYQTDCRYIRNLMQGAGFVQTESLCSTYGNNSSNVNSAFNDGRSFVVYRGQAVTNWWSPFDAVDPNSMTNGFKLPVVVSGTCVTMSLSSTGYYGDRFMNAGTATNPKCAIAYFGTTEIGTSVHRSVVTKGFFKSLFEERTFVLGDITKRAKFILDSLYNNQTRYNEWNLFGDPELNLWTATPRRLIVTHDTVIGTLPQVFTVTVNSGSVACPGALVCLMMDTLIYQTAYTNGSGIATLNISPRTIGTMSVTVTGKNLKPYEGSVTIRPDTLAHDVGIMSIIEPQGLVSLGTNIVPKVKVKNYGLNTDTFSVSFTIGSVYNQTLSTVILDAGDTTTLSFPNWTAVGGTHSIVTYTSLNSDQYHANDTAYGSVNVVVPNDIGIDAILSPDTSQMLNQVIIPKARVKNYGSAAQSNFTATCSIVSSNGTIRYTNTQTIASLAPNDTTIISFSNWTPTVAERCTVKMRTNLVGDQNPSNDAKTKVITIVMLFINEGFNSSSFPPTGWQTVAGGSYNWEWTSQGTFPTCSPYEGAGMVTYQSWYASSGSTARLITPVIPASGVTRCSLKFAMMHDPGYSSSDDQVQVQTSTNGTTFTTVATFNRYSATEAWAEHSVYLGSFSSNFYVAFYAVSAYGNNMFIDYVRLFSPAGINEGEITSLDMIIQTSLNAPKPNPVINGIANISFTIASPSNAALKIYDASGRLIKTLVDRNFEKGVYNYNWNSNDENNRQIAEGIYFCALETAKQKFTKKLILTR